MWESIFRRPVLAAMSIKSSGESGLLCSMVTKCTVLMLRERRPQGAFFIPFHCVINKSYAFSIVIC